MKAPKSPFLSILFSLSFSLYRLNHYGLTSIRTHPSAACSEETWLTTRHNQIARSGLNL